MNPKRDSVPGIDEPDPPAGPPPPPEMPRRVRLYPSQWIGLPLLLLVPVLALAGTFGEQRQTHAIASDAVHFEVDYPTRMRTRQHSHLSVHVVRVGGEASDTVRVEFDPAWVQSFARLELLPQPARPWIVELAGVEVGDTAVVRLGLEARERWRRSGYIRLQDGRGGSRDIAIRTFILP